jgi:hypothetical protein
MKIFRTSGVNRAAPRWSADASAAQFSEAFRKLLYALAVFFLMAITLGGCGYAGTPPLPSVTLLLEPGSAVVGLGRRNNFRR